MKKVVFLAVVAVSGFAIFLAYQYVSRSIPPDDSSVKEDVSHSKIAEPRIEESPEVSASKQSTLSAEKKKRTSAYKSDEACALRRDTLVESESARIELSEKVDQLSEAIVKKSEEQGKSVDTAQIKLQVAEQLKQQIAAKVSCTEPN